MKILFSAILVFATFASISAQLNGKVHANSLTLFGPANNLSDVYQGNLTDLEYLVDSPSDQDVDQLKLDLKNAYNEVNNTNIEDEELDQLLVPNQTNYDNWMNLYNNDQDSYAIRSIIVTIQSLK